MGGEEGAIGADRGSSLEFESPGEARLVHCDGRAYVQSLRLSLRKLGVRDLEGSAAVESRNAWRTCRVGVRVDSPYWSDFFAIIYPRSRSQSPPDCFTPAYSVRGRVISYPCATIP